MTVKSALSRELSEEASRFIPGGVNSMARKVEPPVCVKRAAGAYVEDADGRRYIDYQAGLGPIILGHAHPKVNGRVTEAMQDGILFGVGGTELEMEAARRVVRHVPSAEQVLFCNSGSEATQHAVRLARAATGREKIVKFQGCYHGWHDYVLRNVFTPPERVGGRDPGSAGMLGAAVDGTLVCRYNDAEDVRATVEAHPEQVAAIIVEPVVHNQPTILPKPGFLKSLRELCDSHGTVLIFDEVITGFRHHLGGYQAIAGITPDLTTMGKAIANGFPLAAVGGRRDLMELFGTTPTGTVNYGGTYNGNAVGLAGALATLEMLEIEPVHEHIFGLGETMRAGLQEIAERVGVPAVVSGFGSIFVMAFMEGPLESYDDVLRNDKDLYVRYRQELMARGILEPPRGVRSHISYSHTEADIHHSLEQAEAALRAALDKQQRERTPLSRS